MHLASCKQTCTGEMLPCSGVSDCMTITLSSPLQALKGCGVEFIVAPYEADAQMAYLALNGLVAAVLTEDSDLLPYGCPRVSGSTGCHILCRNRGLTQGSTAVSR